jgi:hypothetical protein
VVQRKFSVASFKAINTYSFGNLRDARHSIYKVYGGLSILIIWATLKIALNIPYGAKIRHLQITVTWRLWLCVRFFGCDQFELVAVKSISCSSTGREDTPTTREGISLDPASENTRRQLHQQLHSLDLNISFLGKLRHHADLMNCRPIVAEN